MVVLVSKNEKFKEFLQKYAKSSSSTEKEASALAIGFFPNLDKKFRFKTLEDGIKNQDLNIKRAAITAVGFSSLHKERKRGKKQRSILKSHLNEPLETIRMTTAISLGVNAHFSEDKKLQKRTFKEFKKKINREDYIKRQGYVVGLGLLSKSVPKEDCLSNVFRSYDRLRMKNPSIYLIGLTLVCINTDRAEEGLEYLLNSIIPVLSNKESRRIAVICCAFLLPLVADPENRLKHLEMLIKGNYEFVSKFGTDSAIVLTYLSFQNDKNQKSRFIEWLSKFIDLDKDYALIYDILKDNKKEIDILQELIKSNTLDIKAAGINASFFLESEDSLADIDSFIEEGLKQRGAGYFDRFLILLRTFSFCLIRKQYDRAKDFESFLHSNDQRVKRFAAIFLTCLKALKLEEDENKFNQIYSNLSEEADENIRWGILIGLSMYNSLGENIFADEIIIGLLLLCLGYIEASTSLLLSQAMIPKFYSKNNLSDSN